MASLLLLFLDVFTQFAAHLASHINGTLPVCFREREKSEITILKASDLIGRKPFSRQARESPSTNEGHWSGGIGTH